MYYNFGVFIGRFQPPHLGHIHNINVALQQCKEVIICIGSSKIARNPKNPWTADEREQMILSCFSKEEQKRLYFIHLQDHLYNDNAWLAQVQSGIHSIIGDDENVVLIGHDKDKTTFYLKWFPQWKFLDTGNYKNISATAIRFEYFHNQQWELFVHDNIKDFLEEFRHTQEFEYLSQELDYYIDYKNRWATVPYAVNFVTVDAVVHCYGHVLLIKRGRIPGKGLYAMPGGFLETTELIKDGVLRELKEETCIKVSNTILEKSLVSTHVFDHPQRSLRGRIITNAFYYDLKGINDKPKVRGADDAAEAEWVSLDWVLEHPEMFFEDHYHILDYFLF